MKVAHSAELPEPLPHSPFLLFLSSYLVLLAGDHSETDSGAQDVVLMKSLCDGVDEGMISCSWVCMREEHPRLFHVLLIVSISIYFFFLHI